MTLRSEFALGHSEFNEFLFASIGEEPNGLQLTVLSALARLGFDPWREAARLSALPAETAAGALATALAALPEGGWKASESTAIATRLVNCLPKHGAAAMQAPPGTGPDRKKTRLGAPVWLLYIGLAAVVLITILRH